MNNACCMNRTYDVIVVGSGPAGSIAAWRLAKVGVTVAVLEKAALPRYKTCGGGIIGRALQTLPLNIRTTRIQGREAVNCRGLELETNQKILKKELSV